MSGPDLRAVIPVGLVLDDVEISSTRIAMTVRSATPEGCCPDCGRRSARVHSRYTRRLLDLPSHGRMVELRVAARRFRCPDRACPRHTFSERLDGRIAPGWARRTARLEDLVHRLGIVLGGRPAASLARRLMLPVSKDTLLRVVRRRVVTTEPGARIIGIDEWAWRRGQRYGTIICDLERRRVLDLLPDREPATVRAWLSFRPGIRVVARDRAGGYAGAIAAAAPLAVQVADRWHLMENASATFLQAVRSEMGPIRRALGAGVIDPALLSATERLQHEGYLRRREENSAIRAMASAGTAIKEIARRTGRSRKLVRAALRNADDEVFRSRQNSLAPWFVALDEAWSAGCRNGAELWRCLRGQGFGGSLRVVGEWATRRRRSEQADGAVAERLPPARVIARAMLSSRSRLTAAEAVMVAAIEAAVPRLSTARALVDRFHSMVRGRTPDTLHDWVAEATTSMVAAFGRGISADLAAVKAALTEAWSNGPTEGNITRLKLLRRQVYGRGKLDLLRARLIAHT
jgi:transposase